VKKERCEEEIKDAIWRRNVDRHICVLYTKVESVMVGGIILDIFLLGIAVWLLKG
jgi:hypothetical protein